MPSGTGDGHPKANAPAYGWIEKVIAKPDGLHAVPRQVNAEFSELVRQGTFKKVSPAFYPPGAAGNPAPGKHYLRHLGFLGANLFSEGEAAFEAPKGYEVSSRAAAVLQTANELVKTKGMTFMAAAMAAEKLVPND